LDCWRVTANWPIAIGFGANRGLRQPLGVAVVGGLVVSEALTLFTIPGQLRLHGAAERMAICVRQARTPPLRHSSRPCSGPRQRPPEAGRDTPAKRPSGRRYGQCVFGAAGAPSPAAGAGGRGSSGQSGRGLGPRRSRGTWQLSTRCSSDALSERRSFNVRASCATAKEPATVNKSITAANLFMLKAPCGKSD